MAKSKDLLASRASGVLLHPTSLPGRFGIGDLGKEARGFVDFLEEAQQTFWLILPLGPTSEEEYHCPYSSYSAFAGNWLLISPEGAYQRGYCGKADLKALEMRLKSKDSSRVDLRRVSREKRRFLYDIFTRQQGRPGLSRRLADFQSRHPWLRDFALFAALRKSIKKPRSEWSPELRSKDLRTAPKLAKALREEMEFEIFCQSLFFEQWLALKQYANRRGIYIFGDLPFYVSDDSADVWAAAEFFALDPRSKRPALVSGVPPDLFSRTGQLWNHPVYNWKALKQDRFSWWNKRMQTALSLLDVVRIDHFRAFAAYWAVPGGSKTAIHGKWYPCPGREVFESLRRSLGNLPIVAEDLGVITKDVTDLRDGFGLLGMRVLQFGFMGECLLGNCHAPFNITPNNVAFTGTHDNETSRGWLSGLPAALRRRVMSYLGNPSPRQFAKDFIKLAMGTSARISIYPMQDLLGLGNEARMNLPGTTGWKNWSWRNGAVPAAAGAWLRDMTALHCRNPRGARPAGK